jgi:integrase
MKLSDIQCRTAKPKEKPYKMPDGAGLYLLVNPNGSKYWRMKYRYQGVDEKTGEAKRREKLLSFGTYPLVTLADAREERDKAKRLLIKGTDPANAKKADKRETVRNSLNSFKAIALEWHENQKGGWSENHANNVLHRLERDVFPEIGNMPINSIEPPDLLDALRKIEKRGALDIASRAKQISGQVFRYGIQTGRCKRNPAPDLQGALKTRKTKHFPALDVKEIPEFLQALERNEARLFPRTRRAIMLSMLTFVRPNELRNARWDEIDMDAKEWVIPAEKMKMRRVHVVPLSRQAIEILKEQHKETGYIKTPFVFPSLIKPRQCISDGTVNVAIKKLGFAGRMTAHGFRALARTTIREKLGYEPDVIECQLAHKAAGALGEAYNRAQFLDKRKVMMQDWANYIDSVASGGKVVRGNFGEAA